MEENSEKLESKKKIIELLTLIVNYLDYLHHEILDLKNVI